MNTSRRRKLPATKLSVDSRSTIGAGDSLLGRALPRHQSARTPGDGFTDKTMPRSTVPRALEGAQIPTLVRGDLPCYLVQHNVWTLSRPVPTLAALCSSNEGRWPDLAQATNDNQYKQICRAIRPLHMRGYFHLMDCLLVSCGYIPAFKRVWQFPITPCVYQYPKPVPQPMRGRPMSRFQRPLETSARLAAR